MENNRVYVGQRYVPKIMGEWSKLETYEGLSIVTNEGNSYTSKKRVPMGVDLFNEEYWASTGNYNAQIEHYRAEVVEQTKSLNSFKEESQKQVDEIKKHLPDFVNVLSFGLDNTGLTDNTAKLQTYIDEIQNEFVNLYFPAGTYLFEGTVSTVNKIINFKGDYGLTNLIADTSTTAIFKHAGGSIYMGDLRFTTNSNERTEFTVYVENCSRLTLNKVDFYNHGGKESGVSVRNVTTTRITGSIYSHASISLRSWDVKITDTWVWALWRPYGIGIHGGCGNISLSNVDVVPPFRETPDAKAGIWINSEGGNPTNSVNMDLIYFDGNPNIDTGVGLLIDKSTFGIELTNYRANYMNSDVIVIDTSYNVDISKGIHRDNNALDLEAREIVIKNTGTGKQSDIVIDSVSFLNFRTSGITKPTPAIKVEESANGAVELRHNKIGQQGNGLAYGLKEIDVPSIDKIKLSTNKGTTKVFRTERLVTMTAGEKTKTIPFSSGTQLAYKPDFLNVKIVPIVRNIPPYSLQISDANNAFINFDAALTNDISFYLVVEL